MFVWHHDLFTNIFHSLNLFFVAVFFKKWETEIYKRHRQRASEWERHSNRVFDRKKIIQSLFIRQFCCYSEQPSNCRAFSIFVCKALWRARALFTWDHEINYMQSSSIEFLTHFELVERRFTPSAYCLSTPLDAD